jgi:hypothetical protein
LKRKGYSGMFLSSFHPLFTLISSFIPPPLYSRPLFTLTPLSSHLFFQSLTLESPNVHPSPQGRWRPLHPSTISHLPTVDDRWSMVANNPGEGFNSSGTPLSGLKKDEYHGKLTGLAAAEKRLAVQKKIGKGGVLGGSSVLGRSMKDVLAEVCPFLHSILPPSLPSSLPRITLISPIPLAVPLPLSIILCVPS